MTFWSSQTIIDRGTKEKIIEPFEESKVKESAYSLSVGDEIFITSASNDKFEPQMINLIKSKRLKQKIIFVLFPLVNLLIS